MLLKIFRIEGVLFQIKTQELLSWSTCRTPPHPCTTWGCRECRQSCCAARGSGTAAPQCSPAPLCVALWPPPETNLTLLQQIMLIWRFKSSESVMLKEPYPIHMAVLLYWLFHVLSWVNLTFVVFGGIYLVRVWQVTRGITPDPPMINLLNLVQSIGTSPAQSNKK